MRERVTIQSETRNPDAAGGALVSWSALPHAPTAWARVEPLLGHEALQAMQLKAPISYRVTMRWRDDITAAMANRRASEGTTPVAVPLLDHPQLAAVQVKVPDLTCFNQLLVWQREVAA